MALQANALTTVAKVKEYMKISYSNDDTLLEDLINEVSDWIEKTCCRRIKDTGADVTEYYDGQSSGQIRLLAYPVTNITSVAYASGDLNAPTWTIVPAATGYRLSPQSSVLNVVDMYRGVGNYRVIYRGGYATPPSDIVRACKMIVADAYHRSGSDGAANESVGGASVGWEEHIPARAQDILDRYTVITF